MRSALWLAGALLLVPVFAAQPVADPQEMVTDAVRETVRDVDPPQDSPQFEQVRDLIAPPESKPDDGAAAPDKPGEKPDFADRVATAFEQEAMMWGVGSAALVLVSLGGFAAVTRYISPKEALKNPQRSMLFGYVKGNPGVHLKQLSEEFSMKTSSILWHIRKLESAELVKSERVGGFRVFYAVEGGVEIKRVSRAMTSLQNDNARRIFERVRSHPGQTTRQISEALHLHGGTARWHLRKLRDNGLLDELVQESGSKFFNTPLGDKALDTFEGAPVETPTRRPSPIPVE